MISEKPKELFRKAQRIRAFLFKHKFLMDLMLIVGIGGVWSTGFDDVLFYVSFSLVAGYILLR